MLALSPPLFSSTNYGWPSLEDLNLITTQHLPLDCNDANSYNNNTTTLLDHLHTYGDQIKHDHFEPISSSGAANGSTGDDMTVEKKLNHNASERDRRKRVNDLYTFLGSLLPMSRDQKQKKVSIPGTVSRALKYIPELQKEVESLRCKREKLSSTVNTRQEHLGIKKQRVEDAIIKTQSSSVVSSVSSLGEKEAVIQLISPPIADHLTSNNDQEISLLSRVLEYLEEEEDELVLNNATTFRSCMGDQGMLLSTLHLQVQGDHKIRAEKLKEKLDLRLL